ncbi:LOW QUALITY PROTEIN: neural-cadherin [Sebastes umbrosus]|uniref:LOW QUALITY PROTEIN: neural-cadherin n=1 Tax=Sebastes umbrosus TaxID=72105 RepID=UPI0018A0AAAF|nr:LOW QUALITY PROTEIN: neural-cadherin [Sebastes umbrosus]
MSKAAAGPVLLHHLLLHLLHLPVLLLLLHASPVCLSAQPGHPARYFGQIAENSPAGTPVEAVTLPVCPGADLNASLMGDYASDFRLIHHHGHRDHRGHLGLVSAKPLDREFIAMYELTVELPPRCLRRPAAVQVEVSDRNDNIPRFTSGNQTVVEVDELTPLGTELARFDAKDGDAERNGRITFYASPESHLLHVVPQTGQVRLVGSLLGVRQVTLRLYVSDGGDVSLIGDPVFLRVTVLRSSRAHRRPRALTEELTYTVTVPDHGTVGDLVFTVPDQKFEQRWFEVMSVADSPVQIERDSGRLYLARSLREPAEVLVKIHSRRGDDWYLCRLTLSMPSQANLQWLMFPSPYLGAVGPDATPGSVVYRLSARQRDGMLGQPQFLLLDGGEECFEVDRRSGEISTTGRPLTPSKEYLLRVQAMDGSGRKGPPATVAILAGYRPPQFTNATYSLNVPENAPVGQPVSVVQAVSFQKKSLSYMLLVNPGNLFSINQASGALSLTRTVDYESGHNLHTLQVRASELDTSLSGVAEVVVHITDENDCTPEFLHAIYTRDNVPESTAPGTSLLQVLARDCDSGVNSELSYFVHGDDFDITSGGVVSPARRLDYERPNHVYEFVVVAVDAGTPPRTGTASVRIRVANSNDEAPVFSQSAYKTFLSEDAGPDTLVAIVHANDPDGDAVSYAITGGNEDSNFLLDNQKGIIKLRRSPPPRLRGPQYVLNITATDDNASGGPYPLSSSAQVIVGINDINNNKPLFQECQNYSLNAVVLENLPPGTFVLRVQAHDADMGVNGEVKYGIMHRDGVSSGFDIDPDTGVIATTVSFDRERQREYTLSVTATDQAEEPLIGICQITVVIADQNDNDPKFENSRYQYFLREDTPVGTSFLRAAAHDDDQGSNAAITYSLSNQNPAYLHINPSTGWIYVNYPISQTSRINQQIVASDGGNRSSSVELTVIITNVHNQPPHWEQPEYWVTVPENTVRDAKIVTIKATSPLGDPRVTYNLEEGQVPETNMPVRFYIKPNRADSSASILVAENLDYETTRFFTLRVRVQNVAAVPLASFTTVYVNVTDVNDNVPFFLSSTYEATVPEGAEIGTSVAQVSATDLDSGLHGMVHYVILKDESGDSQFFSIDSRSGVIVTRASFDREQKASYLIEVQSQDSSESSRPGQQGQPNTDTAYVRIFIADVNDNAPAFARPVYEVSVEEDKEVGFVLITVTANDEDEGANAKLRYQITSGNTMGTFDVEPEVGTIFVAQPLDYEMEQRYELRLVASDGKWENETLVVVQVVNRNDEAPVFSQTEYHAAVTEELTQLPVFMLEVSATDPDQEADQTALRYSLHGQGAGGEFTIDEHTGRIYAQRRLDREERPAWRFLVLATDEGGAGLTGFADVLLEVRDVNDNAPFFPCPALEVDGCFVGQVPENSPADTSVMEMRAMDLDDPNEGKNAMLTYSIIKNVRNEINLNLFSINASTGTIYTVLRSLDREVEERYLVVVEARDGGGLAGTGTATIMISDVNDHPPVFTQRIYTTQVTEDLEVNSEVLVVSATDGDEGENAVVTFSIVGGDEDRKFFVETDKVNRRGVIKLKKKVDFEKPRERTFNLTLKAEDADFFSLAYCLIQVEDANDQAPVFFPQFYESPAMSEDVPVGTIVAQVTASDLDSGQNGRFSYSISRESDPYGQFLVDQSGWVVVADSLDREKISQHRIMVLATDAGSPPMTGTAIVMVTVLDINDNGPEFEVSYEPVVWENTAAPQAVRMNETSLLLHATDRDTSTNGAPFSIRLLMLTSDATNFNLTDFRNGSAAITALRTFDRERQKEYRLPILMIDSGSPPMSSTSTLTVVIGDRNDHPHSPGHTNFVVYSYEGILPTTVLGRVQSPDLDDWSEKVYRFEGKPSRLFSLNQSSGQLSIREGAPPGSYRLQVRVSDHTWPDVTSTAQVDVRELQQDALRNAASIRLNNLTVEEFFCSRGGEESRFSRLGRMLAELLQTLPENVQIFSAGDAGQSGEKALNVWFAAHGSPYYKAEKLHGYVAANKAKLEAMLGVSISQVGVDECLQTDCSQSGGCSSEVSFSQAPLALSTGNTSLVSLTASSTARCGCRGREAIHLPCSAYPTNPCLRGGTCQDGPLGYRCVCPPMFDGPECQQTKHSFGGQGYAWFPPIMPCFQSHISLEFLAESANGLLLYNGPLGPAHSGEQEDFIAVELRNGVPALSINHGSGTLTLQLPPKSTVTDRRWHRLDIVSDGKAVQLILDQCGGVAVNELEGVGGDSQETDESGCRAAGETPGNQRYLNVFQPLQLGGVKETSPHRRYRSFTGCIRNLVVDSQVYDLASPGESVDSTPGCRLTDGVCVTAAGPSCGAHASCLADWGSFSCECHPGYTGHKCDSVVPEFSFDLGSVVRYQLRGGGSSRRTNVQLLLRTRAASGTLLSVTSREANEYIFLEIMEGHVSVRANLGDGAHALRLPGQRVDIGQWVLVSLSRRDNLFTLRLEQGGGSREVQARLGNRREIVVHPASVMVGNSPNAGEKTDFQGCLRDVRFNAQVLPLDGQSRDLVTVLERRGVTSGCSSDACSSQPCRSPLRCIDLWRKHQCKCPGGQVTVTDDSDQQHCVPSPCGPSSCRNGGTCQALSPDSYRCRCQEGFRGQRCELGQVKGHRLAALSPSSILAISMCLLVFFAVLVAVTVWNQKGSRNKFRKRGVYHIPAEHESWEDIRENILNYNEEGGGEQDQNGYDITELKRPLCSSLSQSSSCTTAPLIKSSPGSQEEVHPSGSSCSSGAPYLSIPHHHHHPHHYQHAPANSYTSDATYANFTTHRDMETSNGYADAPSGSRSHVDFKSYVARIIWEADNDSEALPPDAYHVWCVEGSGSSVGSLSSLGSAASRRNIVIAPGDEEEEEDEGGFVNDRLSRWGPKFQSLSEMYDRPQLALTYREAVAYIQRSHSHNPLPQHH